MKMKEPQSKVIKHEATWLFLIKKKKKYIEKPKALLKLRYAQNNSYVLKLKACDELFSITLPNKRSQVYLDIMH